MPAILRGDVLGLYRLEPLGRAIEQIVDFDRLNGGDIRLSVLTTDLATGEPVVFDTGAGDRIEAEHLMASCGFLPDFAPREVGGRLLGDGAFIGERAGRVRARRPERRRGLDLIRHRSLRP